MLDGKGKTMTTAIALDTDGLRGISNLPTKPALRQAQGREAQACQSCRLKKLSIPNSWSRRRGLSFCLELPTKPAPIVEELTHLLLEEFYP